MKKQHSIDDSLLRAPEYSTDEFRIYKFKVRGWRIRGTGGREDDIEKRYTTHDKNDGDDGDVDVDGIFLSLQQKKTSTAKMNKLLFPLSLFLSRFAPCSRI